MVKNTEEVFNAIQEQQKETYKKLYPDISVTFENQELVDKVPIKIGDKIYYRYKDYLYDKIMDKIVIFIICFDIILLIISFIIKKN